MNTRLNQLMSFSDNSPDSLLLVCVKYVVKQELDIRGISLPQEICDLLIEVYREQHLNSDLSAESFAKFLNQFRSSNSRISVANFSKLPINDETLESFLEEHSKTITSLDISDCRKLTLKALEAINTITIRISDQKKLHRTVCVVEEGPLIESRILYTKHYSNGVITTMRDNSCIVENVGQITDDYGLTQAMGVFDDPDFVDFQSNKIRELNGIKSIDFEEPMSVDGYHDYKTANKSPIIAIESDYKPFESFTKHIGDNKIKTLIIKTWQNSPLQSLTIVRPWYCLPYDIEGVCDKEFCNPNHLINPLLLIRKLVIHSLKSFKHSSRFHLKYLINSQMKNSLLHLDLSRCDIIEDGAPLSKLKSLKTLILYNSPKLQLAVDNICKIKTLRCLDISYAVINYVQKYEDPNKVLTQIVTSLPELTRLDISGTNLAGPMCEHIPGLESRSERPLEFLGLYYTDTKASFRKKIPALSISGNASEEQLLTACEAYTEREELLRSSLSVLRKFKINFQNLDRYLNIVLVAISVHLQTIEILRDNRSLRPAFGRLYDIIESEEAQHINNFNIKRQIIDSILYAMNEFIDEYNTFPNEEPCGLYGFPINLYLIRSGMKCLKSFLSNNDLIFDYLRLIKILLYIVTNDKNDYYQGLAIKMFGQYVCRLDANQKTIVGEWDAINKMLALIDARLHRSVCDEVMEIVWSILWNITLETPINCKRFLDKNGMNYFMSCLHSFPHNTELLRYMMGVLANVAECPHLRPTLMNPDFIEKFPVEFVAKYSLKSSDNTINN